MNEIVKSCKHTFSLLAIFSVAILLLLMTDNDWKQYSEAANIFQKLNGLNFNNWRLGEQAKAAADFKPYIDSIKIITDSTFQSDDIAFNAGGKGGYFLNYVFGKKGNSFYYPENLPLKSFSKNYDRSLSAFKPNLEEFKKRLDLVLSQFSRSFFRGKVYLESVSILPNLVDNNIKTEYALFYMDGMEKIYLKFPAIAVPGEWVQGQYLSYGDWIDKELQGEDTLVNVDSKIEPEIANLTISKAYVYLRKESSKKLSKISFLGLQFNGKMITILAPLTFTIFLSVIIIMLQDLLKSIHSNNFNKEKFAYWMLLKNNYIGLITGIMALGFPMLVFLGLICQYLPLQTVLFRAITISLFMASLALSIADAWYLSKIRKIFPFKF